MMTLEELIRFHTEEAEKMKLHRKAGEKPYEDGYLTIFLALSITVLLSLILVLLEGARINAI